jgi:hypothetical protein
MFNHLAIFPEQYTILHDKAGAQFNLHKNWFWTTVCSECSFLSDINLYQSLYFINVKIVPCFLLSYFCYQVPIYACLHLLLYAAYNIMVLFSLSCVYDGETTAGFYGFLEELYKHIYMYYYNFYVFKKLCMYIL